MNHVQLPLPLPPRTVSRIISGQFGRPAVFCTRGLGPKKHECAWDAGTIYSLLDSIMLVLGAININTCSFKGSPKTDSLCVHVNLQWSDSKNHWTCLMFDSVPTLPREKELVLRVPFVAGFKGTPKGKQPFCGWSSTKNTFALGEGPQQDTPESTKPSPFLSPPPPFHARAKGRAKLFAKRNINLHRVCQCAEETLPNVET